MDVLDRVKSICSFLSGVAVSDIGDHQPLDCGLPDGLDLDSLDRLELIMEVEESFGIEIPDGDVDRMTATPVGISAYLSQRGVAQWAG
jgi:acyl carrier protein